MKTLFLSLFALCASAQAADSVTLSCRGSNLILDQVKTITWTQDEITLNGTMNGVPYSVDGKFTRTYSGNGYAYGTAYGEVIIPFDLISGARDEAEVQLSNSDYANEVISCSRN